MPISDLVALVTNSFGREDEILRPAVTQGATFPEQNYQGDCLWDFMENKLDAQHF